MRIADSHSDFLAFCVMGLEGGHVYDQGGLERLRQGGVALQNLAIWAPADVKDRTACSMSQVAAFYRLLREAPAQVHLCTRREDVVKSGIGFVLSIESGESIDCRTERISQFYGWGVRIISLTWNFENAFASGCLSTGGIKPRGYEALRIIDRLDMALDLSHINEEGFWEALRICNSAPCATHSCVYDLCPNPRNLRKAQIEAIIERDGYIGINFFTEFLTGKEATSEDVVNHIEYVIRCGGENAVGLGSDFCGMYSAPDGLKTAADFQTIPAALERRGYSAELIDKICYGNFARYILQFLKP